MKTLEVKITFTEGILGTSPNDEDIYRNFIIERAKENGAQMDEQDEQEEVDALPLDEEIEKGMTVFPRDENGNPFLYDYQVKGFFKDACSMLRKVKGTKSAGIKAFKKEIDGLIFPNPRQIVFQNAKMGVCQRPLRANTAQGERVALAMSEEDYYAFRDRSRRKRISPYPISPTDRSAAKQAKQPERKPSRAVADNAESETDEPVEIEPVVEIQQPVVTETPPAKTPAHTGTLYDIELCIVNTQVAAQREVSRLPNDLQDKALFRRNQINNQVHVILAIADSRSHAVRTQAMLIDELPDSCLIPHEK